jgi:uncharacterized protein YegP (UPF0339 family)
MAVNLKTGNHQSLGTTKMYASQESCEKTINSVATNDSARTIKDLT